MICDPRHIFFVLRTIQQGCFGFVAESIHNRETTLRLCGRKKNREVKLDLREDRPTREGHCAVDGVSARDLAMQCRFITVFKVFKRDSKCTEVSPRAGESREVSG